ncbi:MAG: ParA family protein [Sulfurimonas sp.]|uniref:ParA family protein n=1 Tax=Sulfurimonas sp. TaxID=2022749 RepID=UPI0028CE1A57|nr:ParA family protein [Sulfurimonas sp.]MDT8338558.1 ParA family protein [Sulfurimonas sp.]
MIYTVGHTKGGVGKSTLAWNLAHSFKELGKKVTIVDLDFQQTLFFINSMNGGGMEVLQPKTVEELIRFLLASKAEEVIIIDVGGFDSDINRTAIDFANTVLIPISDSITEVLGFKTFEAILDEMILGDTNAKIVLNNIHPLTKNFDIIKEAVAGNSGITLLSSIVRSRKIYKTSLGQGYSVFGTPNKKAINEIRAVRDELIRT